MHHLADVLLNALLKMAPWYRPRDIAAREQWTERVHQDSIAARLNSEKLRSELDGALTAFQRRR
jgi:hypothetical protein